MTGDGTDGFLSRWSRRKRAAAVGGAVGTPVADVPNPPLAEPVGIQAAEDGRACDAGTTRPAEVPPTLADGPVFDVASLPAPETLTATSDITAFLRAEVPAALRRAALRRIWTLDPGIRDFVGPADYAWDYNAPDGVPGFALHLGGDAKKLLAQAMGWQPEAVAEDAATRQTGISGLDPTPDAKTAAEPAPMASLSPADLELATEAEPEPLTISRLGPPEAAIPLAAAVRRHGGARPA